MRGKEMKPIYNRVLLKISGEALAGEQHFGINEAMTQKGSQRGQTEYA